MDHDDSWRGAVVFLMGPTGTGKSELAIAVAERLPFELVSVDSALVYRGLDIGTAKPTPAQRARTPHHLIDLCDAGESYSAARFRIDARRVIEAIHSRGRVPLLVGGTGLYFRALEHGIADLPGRDEVLRAQLDRELNELGPAALHARLSAVDPESAGRIHPNDPQRLVRALEVYELTGSSMSTLWAAQAHKALPFRPLKIVLAPVERERLHRRIARRFELMVERGLVNEVTALRRRGDLSLRNPAMRAVGYREVWRYLERELEWHDMKAQAIIATRQLAKRQLTWFRRERSCVWLHAGSDDLIGRVEATIASQKIFA